MGKRELFIILAFVAAGVAIYRVAAPPTKPGEGFSLSKLWTNARRTVQSDRATAEWQTSQVHAVAPSVRELRIRDVNGPLVVTGENRPDIAIEFTVRSTGPDDAAAQDLAKNSILHVDALEDAIVFSVKYPEGGHQTGRLTLHVPKALSATVTESGGITASDLGGLRMMGATSGGSTPSTVTNIAGAVSGTFGSGTLQVRDAGSVDLTLLGTRSTFTHIRGTTRLDVRSGVCHLVDVLAPAEVTARQAEIVVEANAASVRLSGTSGSVTIARPKDEVRVDFQRARVSAQLDMAVPLSLSTTDADVTIALADAVIDLDAVATNGDVLATDWALTATKRDQDSVLTHTFGPGPRVSLRTTNGNIVIKKDASVVNKIPAPPAR